MSYTSRPSALVTGASSGIGYEAAVLLGSYGYQVFAGVRKSEDANYIQEKHAGQITPIILDVTKVNSRQNALDEITESLEGHGLNALVNNAGISYCSPLEFADQEHFECQMQTNYIAPLMTIKSFLPLLRHTKGRIVNVSSGAGRMATPLMGAYSASKSALESASDALRVELRRHGIGVSIIVPGYISTPIQAKNSSDIDHLLEALPQIGLDYYQDAIGAYRHSSEKMSRNATEPAEVAKVIYKAINDRKPKARYYAGNDAKLMRVVVRFLSDARKDNIVGRITGL